MSRILVTGAAGFIGSHLVDRLLDSGHEVVGLDAFTENYSRERKLENLRGAGSSVNFRLVEEYLPDFDVRELLRESDGVVHLAAEPGVRPSWGENFTKYLERNILATQRLLEAAAEVGVGKFVFASSSSIYGQTGGGPVGEDTPRRPASPYGLSKLSSEELVRLYGRDLGVPATILRYFTVYGPRQRPEMAISRFASAALRGENVQIYGDGEQDREMTYVLDVVAATVAALEAEPGGPYNIGGGTRATVNEMIEIVGQATGKQIEVEYAPAAQGDVRSTSADCARAEKELGYHPQTGLEEGIAEQVKWALAANPLPED